MFEMIINFLVNFKFDQCEDDGIVILYSYAKNESGCVKKDRIFAQRLHEFRSWSSGKKSEAIQQSVQNVKARYLSCRITFFDNSDDGDMYQIRVFTNGKILIGKIINGFKEEVSLNQEKTKEITGAASVIRLAKKGRHPCNPPTCAPNQYYTYHTYNT